MLSVLAMFGLLETLFPTSNLTKRGEGGWFPLVMGLGLFILLTTWKRGTAMVPSSAAGSTSHGRLPDWPST